MKYVHEIFLDLLKSDMEPNIASMTMLDLEDILLWRNNSIYFISLFFISEA